MSQLDPKEIRPRPAQANILKYRSGYMGVSAVPGSGKTWTLSMLAAQLIQAGMLVGDQEVLVVTLVNSAVENFNSRIRSLLRSQGVLPDINFRVRTLHALANDIVSERPDLVLLSGQYEIVDELVAEKLLTDIIHAWIRTHADDLENWILPELDESRKARLFDKFLPDHLMEVTRAVIKRAKDYERTPDQLSDLLRNFPQPLPLLEMAIEAYEDYQRALAYRGAVDFDDLIRLASQAIKMDSDLLDRLRNRWPYILEDEAQDSSRLQEHILRYLAGRDGNWVRVGDPNQAIYETFTTANPELLRDFIASPSVQPEELPNSGRSSASIIYLANQLIQWVQDEHPVLELRNALAPPFIMQVPPGDPQINPQDRPDQIFLYDRKLKPQEEVEAVANSVGKWLETHPDQTAAILVTQNMRGFQVVEALRARKIPHIEMLRSAGTTRQTAGALGYVLKYLADPKSAKNLAKVYEVWRRDDREDENLNAELHDTTDLLSKCGKVESFLSPQPGEDWLDQIGLDSTSPIYQRLVEFRGAVTRWQEAASLPIDQLILTVAQDIFHEPGELALSHKLALVLKRMRDLNQSWRLPELKDELVVIAKNERRFLGFSDDETRFDPANYPGKVVVTTMHRAKGLEWDRVYLMSVNNYDFPSAMQGDSYISEKWYIRDHLDLQAEALEQLEVLLDPSPEAIYLEGEATTRMRLSYAAERLRLFYVGITRTKSELVITWNTGRRGDLHQAVPFAALSGYWADRQKALAEVPESLDDDRPDDGIGILGEEEDDQ